MYARLTTKLELVDSVRQVVRHVTRPVENVAILFSKLKQRFFVGRVGGDTDASEGRGQSRCCGPAPQSARPWPCSRNRDAGRLWRK